MTSNCKGKVVKYYDRLCTALEKNGGRLTLRDLATYHNLNRAILDDVLEVHARKFRIESAKPRNGGRSKVWVVLRNGHKPRSEPQPANPVTQAEIATKLNAMSEFEFRCWVDPTFRLRHQHAKGRKRTSTGASE